MSLAKCEFGESCILWNVDSAKIKKPAFSEMRMLQHMKSAKRNLSKIDCVKRMSLVKHEPQVLQCRSRDIQSQQ